MILIDDRSGSAELSLAFENLGVCPIKVTRLPSGDFNFTGYGPDKDPDTGDNELVSVGVERKTFSDFIASTETARFTVDQLRDMIHYHHFRFLVLEAGIRASPEDRTVQEFTRGGWGPPRMGKIDRKLNGGYRTRSIPFSSIDGRLFSLMLQAGVHVIRTRTYMDTVETVTNLYSWFQKPWDEHSTLKQIRHTPPPSPFLVEPDWDKDPEHYQRHYCRLFAKELPGVGWEKSGAVAEEFGSIRSAVNATKQRWLGIDGVGPVIYKKAQRAMGEE